MNYDAIVVGSGATGGIAAKELTEKGLSVLLLEAGPALDEAIFNRPPLKRQVNIWDRIGCALKGQQVQARCSWFSPDKKELFVNDNDNPYTTTSAPYLWIRGRQVGGRFQSWGRVAVRMSDYDFKAASFDGYGDDWPIEYNDLVPYYEQVETFLGVVGREDGIKNLPDGKFTKEAGLSSFEQHFQNTIQNKWPERSFTPWRYVQSAATHADTETNTHITSPIAAAKATGKLTLRPDSVVSKVIVDRTTGLASGVSVVDRVSKESFDVHANVVMLCASTIETVRLLLNSATAEHPDGLANSSGVLGQYFMDQTNGVVFGSVPNATGFELVDGKHPGDNHGGFYIPRFQNLTEGEGYDFLRGYNIQGMVGRIPVPDHIPTIFGLTVQGEMLADKRNQITLNHRKKDAWGIPVANIDIRLGDNEQRMAKAQMNTILEMVKAMGWNVEIAASLLDIHNRENLMPGASWFERTMFKMSYQKSLGLGSAIHECGGARMGHDPKTSVLNKHNQSWDIPNLFITDSSCFVTNGACGPTLTTMALTARAAEYIAKEYTGSPNLSCAV
ncbi:MAG: GMC family oxidoreductase [Gammaproteobacteria bacterium]|nr:GMC family oxidoreductase [Gammaproteobacteria bacterium]